MTARALTEREGGSAKCISKRSSAGDIRFDQEGLHPDTLISNAAPQFWPRKKHKRTLLLDNCWKSGSRSLDTHQEGCLAVFS